MELKLDSKFYNSYLANVNLGAYPASSKAETESSLAGAIGKVWSKQLEIEFQKELIFSPLIGKELLTAIVSEEDLMTAHLGDTLHISKLAQLTGEGSLGTTHSLKDDEENFDLQMVSLKPSRIGNAITWRSKLEHSLSWAIREQVKNLLAAWASTKIEKLILAACESCAEENTLYAGVADSKESITSTDVFKGEDLLRLFACLLDSGAQGISKLGGFFAIVMHPRVYYDLQMDPIFSYAVAQSSVKESYDWKNYVGSYAHFRLFTSTRCHRQLNAASPGEAVYSTYAFGARFAGIGWQKKWSWLSKGPQGDYGEIDGIGTDAWTQVKLLNPEYLYKLQSAGTNPRT